MHRRLRISAHFVCALCVALISGASRLADEWSARVPSAANATISDVKEFYRPGATASITNRLVFAAQVIADPSSANFAGRLVLEDPTGGLEIRLDDGIPPRRLPVLGQIVYVEARGLSLAGSHGGTYLGSADAGGDGLGVAPLGIAEYARHVLPGPVRGAPVVTDVAPHALGSAHSSRLVRICGLQIASADTARSLVDALAPHDTRLRLEDCHGGALSLLTKRGVSFASVRPGAGAGCVTGVLGYEGGASTLAIRRPEDLALDGARCAAPPSLELEPEPTGPLDRLEADFSEQLEREPVALAGWANHTTVKGGRVWEARSYGGNGYAQVSAYRDTRDSVDAWLVSPPVIAHEDLQLSVRTATAFHKHDGLEVLVADDYDPARGVQAASWRRVGLSVADGDDADNEWVSASMALPRSRSEVLNVAFHYRGSGKDGRTSTFRLDDVLLVPQ